MADDLFNRLIEPLLGREGGYANHPDDAGGETIWGVTRTVALEEGYPGQMRAMSRDQAKAIYRSRFWSRPGLEAIANLSAEVAGELFDTGVNMGPDAAARMLQRALNALNRKASDYADLKLDGRLGPATALALSRFLQARGRPGEAVLVKALNCLQGARYIELAEARTANESFVFGWLAQRVGLSA